MAPIRVAIIGLSSGTGEISPSPGDSWAATAHLPYLLKSSLYDIVALCNTSVKSAKAAVEKYDLPSTTRTYGNPEDLAKDPDVNLVVCNVRVDRHYQTMMPILKAGIDAFVEWPLGANLQQAEEMLATAKQSGSRTIVGIQARVDPLILKIKQLVEAEAIGELLSSEIQYRPGFLGDTEPPGCDYMAKADVGGNMLSIVFSHLVNPLFFALGEPETVSAVLSTRWPKTRVLHADGTFDKMVDRETPDHIIVSGILKQSQAPISIFTRGGKRFQDTPALTWSIFGSKGELRATAMAGIGLALGGEKLELFDHEKDTVEVIHTPFADPVKDLPIMAKDTGMIYELFATNGPTAQGLMDFEDAVGMHRILEAITKSCAEGKTIEVPA